MLSRKVRTNFEKKSGKDFPTYTPQEIQAICEKALLGIGSGSEQGYVRNPEYAIRDAALEAWEYLSGKRISEFTGREYFDDLYIGLTMDNWRITERQDGKYLQYKIRVLKRQKRQKTCPKCSTTNAPAIKFCKECGESLATAEKTMKGRKIEVWKEVDLNDPLAKYIMNWLNYLKEKQYQGRIFAIGRYAAWKIMKRLGIINHVNRHWRATHLSTEKNAFELQEELDRATPPTEYVNNNPIKQAMSTKKAMDHWRTPDAITTEESKRI